MTDMLAEAAYKLYLDGHNSMHIAQLLHSDTNTISDLLIPMVAEAEKEASERLANSSSQRALEVARADRWNYRLEAVWESVPDEERQEFIHKFISSFDRLSKARRSLGGLDQPARQDISIVTSTLQTPEQELQALAKELGF